jgi:hypothetical protein
MKMSDEEWIKTIEDGRKVKFIYQELPEDDAFITAQLAWWSGLFGRIDQSKKPAQSRRYRQSLQRPSSNTQTVTF